MRKEKIRCMQEQERTLKVYVGEYVIQIMTHVVTHVIAAVLQVVVILAPAKVLAEHVEDIVVIILVLLTLVLRLLACCLNERDRVFFCRGRDAGYPAPLKHPHRIRT
jgi:hypothetical protein